MFMGVWEGCLHLGDLQGLFAFLGVLGGLGGVGPIRWQVYFVDTLPGLALLSEGWQTRTRHHLWTFGHDDPYFQTVDVFL